MSEGPKDQKGRCPASKQVISFLTALKQQVCFSSVTTSITCEIPAETEFRNSAKTTHVHSSVSALQMFYLVLMVNFNPHQFTNLHYSPGYSQYGDGLLSPFGWLIFSQDSLPSPSQPSFDRAFEHPQPIQPSTVPSAASREAKKSDQRERWSFAREILFNSLVSNLIYFVHVWPPKLLWCKCCDIFVGQLMTQHWKNKATVRPLPYIVTLALSIVQMLTNYRSLI